MGFRTFIFNHMKFPIRHATTLVKTTHFSPVRRLGKNFMDPVINHISYVPITEDIEAPSGILAPLSLVEHFINEASYHAVMNHCICRRGNGCTNHDQSLGCMFLGEAAREIDPRMGKGVTKDEAMAHFNRAVESGLVPGIGQAKADAVLLGVEDPSRLMTVCFCCDCCCLTRALYNAADEMWEILIKLEGVSIERNQDCIGCGECVESCVFKQISMVDGHPVVGDRCKGCGRCVRACKQKAIAIRIDNPDYIDESIARISSTVNVGN